MRDDLELKSTSREVSRLVLCVYLTLGTLYIFNNKPILPPPLLPSNPLPPDSWQYPLQELYVGCTVCVMGRYRRPCPPRGPPSQWKDCGTEAGHGSREGGPGDGGEGRGKGLMTEYTYVHHERKLSTHSHIQDLFIHTYIHLMYIHTLWYAYMCVVRDPL